MDISTQHAVVGGGILTLAVGVGHCFFPRMFGWSSDLPRLSLKNQKILYTLHIFLIPLVLLLAYVSLAHSEELASGVGLGRTLALFCAGLWLVRALWQVIYFRPAQVREHEPSASWLIPIHYGLIVIFLVQFACYAIPVTTWLR